MGGATATVVDINMGCPVDKVTEGRRVEVAVRDPCGTLHRRSGGARSRRNRAKARAADRELRLGWTWVSMWRRSWRRGDRRRLRRDHRARAHTEQKFQGRVPPSTASRSGRRGGRARAGDRQRRRQSARGLPICTGDGVRGVMIGRGALSAPWHFRDCWHAPRAAGLTADPAPPEPTEAGETRHDPAIPGGHDRVPRRAVRDDADRRRITWFGKRLGPCKPLKERVRGAWIPRRQLAAAGRVRAGRPARWFLRRGRIPTSRDAVAPDDAECVGLTGRFSPCSLLPAPCSHRRPIDATTPRHDARR